MLSARHAAGIAATAAVAGIAGFGGLAPSTARAQDSPFDIDEAIAETFARLDEIDAPVYAAAHSDAVPDDGDPITVRRVAVLTFDLGRNLGQDELVADLDGVTTLNEGNVDVGRGQTSWTMVLGEFDRPPELTDNAISNIALAYRYPGQEVLTSSAFANDPLFDMSIVLDRGVADGQPFSSYQQVVGGSWQPFQDQIPTFEFFVERPEVQGFGPVAARSDRSYVRAHLLPGMFDRARFVPSHAKVADAAALYAAIVELAPGEVIGAPTPGAADGLGEFIIDVDAFLGTGADAGFCLSIGEDEGGLCVADDIPGELCSPAGGEIGAVAGECTFSAAPTSCEPLGLAEGGEGFCVPVAGAFDETVCAEIGTQVNGACWFALDEASCTSFGGLVADDTGFCLAVDTPEPEVCGAWPGYEAVDGSCRAIESGVPADEGIDLGAWCLPFGEEVGGACVADVDQGACEQAGGSFDVDIGCSFVEAPDESACAGLGDRFEFDAGSCVAVVAGSDATSEASSDADDPTDAPTANDGIDASAAGGDESTGGSLTAVLIGSVLGLFVLAALGWYFWWRPRATDHTGDDAPVASRPTSARAEREAAVYADRGEVTPEMQQWRLSAELAVSDAFGRPGSTGRWVYEQQNRYLFLPDEHLPEGAEIDEVLAAGEGVLAFVPEAHLEFRLDGSGNLLGSAITDDTPASFALEVTFAQDDGTMNIPVAWVNVVDVASGQVVTSVNSRPSAAELDAIRADNGGSLYEDNDLGRPVEAWIELEPADRDEAIRRAVDDARAGLADHLRTGG